METRAKKPKRTKEEIVSEKLQSAFSRMVEAAAEVESILRYAHPPARAGKYARMNCSPVVLVLEKPAEYRGTLVVRRAIARLQGTRWRKAA